MVEKLLALGLAGLLTSIIPYAGASAQSQTGREPQQAEKVRAKVTKLGTGKQARVEVKLRDNTKLKGYIGEIAEERFTLVDPKRGTVTPVPYEQVQQIKNINHSGLYALALGAATIVGVMLVVAIALRGS